MNLIFRAALGLLGTASIVTAALLGTHEGWVPASDVSDIEHATGLVATQINEASGASDLSAAQREKLSERVGALLATRIRDSADDYMALMGQWGGAFKFREDEQTAGRILASWRPLNDPLAYASFGIEELQVISGAHSPAAPFKTAKYNRETRSAMGVCSFRFNPDAATLLAGNCTIADVMIPATLNNGHEVQLVFRLIWEPGHSVWVPQFIEHRTTDEELELKAPMF